MARIILFVLFFTKFCNSVVIDLAGDIRCGRDFNNALCSNNECCSKWGYCGTTVDHCGAGCQSNCLQPSSPPLSTNGRCGRDFNNALCSNGECCSQWGYCGTTVDHCGTGCQSNCLQSTQSSTLSPTPLSTPSPMASPLISTNGRCGRDFSNTLCPDGGCCSQWGYCVSSADYCGTGCQSNCANLIKIFDKCINPKQIALTFDDGPSPFTDQLLDVLRLQRVFVTFFVIGSKLNTRTANETVLRASRLGHTIGIHTWTHPYLTQLTDEQIRLEISRTRDAIRSITGINPTYFRPPYLDYSARVDTIVRELGLNTVMVNLDSNDWRYFNTEPQRILTPYQTQVTNTKTDSYISLQHDTLSPSIEQVPNILRIIRGAGYTIVPLKMYRCIGVLINVLLIMNVCSLVNN